MELYISAYLGCFLLLHQLTCTTSFGVPHPFDSLSITAKPWDGWTTQKSLGFDFHIFSYGRRLSFHCSNRLFLLPRILRVSGKLSKQSAAASRHNNDGFPFQSDVHMYKDEAVYQQQLFVGHVSTAIYVRRRILQSKLRSAARRQAPRG